MYKNMIPADVIARRAMKRPSGNGLAERAMVQRVPRTGNDATALRGIELFRPAKVVVRDFKHSNPAGNGENIHHEKGTCRG